MLTKKFIIITLVTSSFVLTGCGNKISESKAVEIIKSIPEMDRYEILDTEFTSPVIIRIEDERLKCGEYSGYENIYLNVYKNNSEAQEQYNYVISEGSVLERYIALSNNVTIDVIKNSYLNKPSKYTVQKVLEDYALYFNNRNKKGIETNF
ncbi:MAG: hypothetical protein SOR59_05610 [Lachnospiraceae bacterium]|nr:hypothetical protein [Lachnospiraceae bacterium]